MAVPAALGFRLHTGWMAVVALSGRPGELAVLLRERTELLPGDGSIPRFVYHQAAELEPAQAKALVQRAVAGARKTARQALSAMLRRLSATPSEVCAAGIATGSTVVPADLARILSAHPLIHAAEGKLFQDAVSGACESCGLRVTAVPERKLMAEAAIAYGLDAGKFRMTLDEMRPSVGAPWGADQKTAAAAALLALRNSSPTG